MKENGKCRHVVREPQAKDIRFVQTVLIPPINCSSNGMGTFSIKMPQGPSPKCRSALRDGSED